MAPVSTGSARVTLTIDEVLARIVDKVNVKLVLLWTSISFSIIGTGYGAYATVFTGYIPYREWECKSETCTSLRSGQDDGDFYSYETLCDNDLEAGTDFVWSSELESFSMEWGFYCGSEAKVGLMSSIFFLGSLVGLLVNQSVIDQLGRKRTAAVGVVVCLVAAGGSAVSANYEMLLVFRTISGFGVTVCYTSLFCWLMEVCPPFLRNPAGVALSLSWCAGYLLLIGLSYWLHTWTYIYIALAVLQILALIPFFLPWFPESPRFYLLKGKKEEAVKSLKILARVCDSDIDVDSIDIVCEELVQNYLQQVGDFKKYPIMLKEMLLGCVVWFLIGCLFYSYVFGWYKIGSDLYTIYIFAAIGEVLGYLISAPICRLVGRKRSVIGFLCLAIVCDLVAMIDWDISSDWSLEHVSGIIGSICISAAFVLMYLISAELAPTSHRGMILCINSSAARLGSFVGSYTSLMTGVVDRRVPLAMFTVIAAICCIIFYVLPDTTNRPVPSTPDDVTGRKTRINQQPVSAL